MLCEVDPHYMASEEEAHVIAARELADKFAAQDEKEGNRTGAEYWKNPFVSGCVGGYVFTHVPKAARRSIVVFGRRWRDSNGNTYHTAKVYVNGAYMGTSERAYGYGDGYLQTAEAMLMTAHHLPGKDPHVALWHYCEENAIDYVFDVVDVATKGDL